MNPRQEEGERGGCTIKRKGGGMVSEGVKGVKEGKGGRGGRGKIEKDCKRGSRDEGFS